MPQQFINRSLTEVSASFQQQAENARSKLLLGGDVGQDLVFNLKIQFRDPRLAPVKVAVLPLVNKDGQPERAREIYEDLRRRIRKSVV